MSVANTAAIILAAGKGTRMKSALPKTLHDVAGKPMLTWVLDAVYAAGIDEVCVVFGGQMADFESFLRNYPRSFRIAEQVDRKGTADAVAAGGSCFKGIKHPPYANGRCLRGAPIEADWVLVCAGDVPGIRPELLREFLEDLRRSDAELGVIGMEVPDPTGYGRLVCAPDGQLIKIVEEKDASAEERALRLCNTGIVAAKATTLFSLLSGVTNSNNQGEYYLTDCFGLAREAGCKTRVFQSSDWQQFSGINDQDQKAQVEAMLLGRH